MLQNETHQARICLIFFNDRDSSRYAQVRLDQRGWTLTTTRALIIGRCFMGRFAIAFGGKLSSRCKVLFLPTVMLPKELLIEKTGDQPTLPKTLCVCASLTFAVGFILKSKVWTGLKTLCCSQQLCEPLLLPSERRIWRLIWLGLVRANGAKERP